MQSLLFRLEMTEEARFSAPEKECFAPSIAAGRDLRKTLNGYLQAIPNATGGEAAAKALPDLGLKRLEYRRQLEVLRDDPIVKSMDRELAGRVLVLAGYYEALDDAIQRCHQDVAAIDWQGWQCTYI